MAKTRNLSKPMMLAPESQQIIEFPRTPNFQVAAVLDAVVVVIVATHENMALVNTYTLYTVMCFLENGHKADVQR